MIRVFVHIYGKDDNDVEVLILSMLCHLPLAENPVDLNAIVNDIAIFSKYYSDIRVEMFTED